jgi:2-polyprenyl-3-methyl-5-hydroxy-6-metoxy-1,4-benzoquinol methylase
VDLTDRQRREQAFYGEFMRRNPVEEITFDPVDGLERRPWNPYWFVYEVLRQRCRPNEQRILDFGCGPGRSALRLARMGFEVHGFDICEESITTARKLAARYECGSRATFEVHTAEKLGYADGFFDAVCGFDILHHVDVPRAIAECARVLRPGGLAIFREHLEVPVFDAVRNTRVVKRFAPKTSSLEHEITEDERKLNRNDLDSIRHIFPDLVVHRFRVLSRLNWFVRQEKLEILLERIDLGLIRAIPPLAALGGSAVLVMTKPPVTIATGAPSAEQLTTA